MVRLTTTVEFVSTYHVNALTSVAACSVAPVLATARSRKLPPSHVYVTPLHSSGWVVQGQAPPFGLPLRAKSSQAQYSKLRNWLLASIRLEASAAPRQDGSPPQDRADS